MRWPPEGTGRRRQGEIYDFFRISTDDVSIKPPCCLKMTSTSWRWRALVVRPRLLILDEPSRGGEQHFVHKLGDLLVRLNRDIGLTVLLAEQHLPFIRRVADRFACCIAGVTWRKAALSSWMNRCWHSG